MIYRESNEFCSKKVPLQKILSTNFTNSQTGLDIYSEFTNA